MTGELSREQRADDEVEEGIDVDVEAGIRSEGGKGLSYRLVKCIDGGCGGGNWKGIDEYWWYS